ncbi:hypothetical protein J6590_011737 [Homalodisca vitripennis]|nr:hypothetical protein J6590_011737 [Homalodisca vitripennis]
MSHLENAEMLQSQASRILQLPAIQWPARFARNVADVTAWTHSVCRCIANWEDSQKIHQVRNTGFPDYASSRTLTVATFSPQSLLICSRYWTSAKSKTDENRITFKHENILQFKRNTKPQKRKAISYNAHNVLCKLAHNQRPNVRQKTFMSPGDKCPLSYGNISPAVRRVIFHEGITFYMDSRREDDSRVLYFLAAIMFRFVRNTQEC